MKLRYLLIPLTQVPEPYRLRIETGIWVAWGIVLGIAVGTAWHLVEAFLGVAS